MPHINVVLKDGTKCTVECAAGESIMHAASAHGLPGIEAVCGGFCNCATCHVYVDEPWISRLPPPGEAENEMLDGVATERLSGSRLACQVTMSAELDGIEVRMPETQS